MAQAQLAVTSGVEDICGFRDVEQMFQKLCKIFLPQLTKIVNDLANVILKVMDDAVQNILEIGKKGLRITIEAKEVCQKLLTVISKFGVFMAKVKKFAWHARDEERKADILKALRKEELDLTPMNEYFEHLRRCLDRALKSYGEFEDHCLSVQKNLADVHDECKDTARDARNLHRGTQAVGGTAAGVSILTGLGGGAGALVAGVSLSLAAGVPTLGIGAIIGLAVTGVAFPVVGIVVGGTVTGSTYVLADHYKGRKRALECLAELIPWKYCRRCLMHQATS